MKKYSDYNKSEYSEIPLLQRDYVQGSDCNSEKRDNFLNAIFRSLAGLKDRDGNVYSGRMDFIYGSSVPKSTASEFANQVEQRDGFMPIDGQQRLTTLALIGWLLVQKCDREDYIMPCLRYRTRHTTEQFCNHLMSYKLPADCADIRSHLMTEPIWMAERWLRDPSVNAMLDLLASADAMLKKEEFAPHINVMAERFFNDSPLTFELLDMESYDLTEDLYIKMNARGKHLSEFENWKAEFTGMLETNYKDVEYEFRTVEGKKLTIPEYFAYAIEHEWTDLLWPASLRKWEELDDKSKAESAYPRIDEQFVNVLDFITKALFYSQFPESAGYSEFPTVDQTNGADWATRFAGKNKEWLAARRVDLYRSKAKFRNRSNVITLFNMLDALCEIDKQFNGDWQRFFQQFIYNGRWNNESDGINLFDVPNADVNLVGRCINGTLTMPLEFLLWGILNYCVKYPDETSTGGLSDFVRVLWGWILSKRQRLGQKELSVEPDIRVENYAEFGCVVDALLADKSVYQSLGYISHAGNTTLAMAKERKLTLDEQWMQKAFASLKSEIERNSYRKGGYAGIIDRLIGCQYLKGDFSNLYSAMSTTEPDVFMSNFEKFYGMDEWTKAKVLIEHGWVGVCDIWGDRYPFYGKNRHWDYVFTTKESNFAKAITSYLQSGQALLPDKNTIEYYISKYWSFYDAHRWDQEASHLYYVENDFYVTSLLSTFAFRMPHYQLCPYALTVVNEINDKNPEIAQKLSLINSPEYADHGCIRFNNERYWIECVENGWRFEFKDSIRWQSKWRERFIIDEAGKWSDSLGKFQFRLDEDGCNLLLDNDSYDRVEMCVLFLKELYRLIIKT